MTKSLVEFERPFCLVNKVPIQKLSHSARLSKHWSTFSNEKSTEAVKGLQTSDLGFQTSDFRLVLSRGYTGDFLKLSTGIAIISVS